ncbi:MAG: Fic family protein [Eubacteriales bacterium]|nr:Fic family protein [Eubacteriales bacterium]
MKFVSVAEIAKKWNVSDRMVRNYCAEGRIPGAFQTGRTWNIPEDAVKPAREPGKQFSDNKLLNVLKEQKDSGLRGGIYHKTQIEFTYNSNHIEGSTLTHEQTRYIFETNTIGAENSAFNVDDVVETANHFKCVDYIIDNAKKPLSESMIKELHFILKNGTSDSRKNWFNVGEYKKLPNEVGGNETCPPENVKTEMKKLLSAYNGGERKTLDEILEFHKKFESIHPLQDGNGRIGRLIMFKECLMNDVVPFIIDEEHKWYYYRGLKEWNKEKGYLTDTCLSCQDKYKEWLMYFKIEY